MAAPPSPFPRYQGLRSLTWDQCFAASRADILNSFVTPLMAAETDAAAVRGLSQLLRDMMNARQDQPQGTTITTALTAPPQLAFQDNGLPENAKTNNLRYVHWSPAGSSHHLKCYTVTDLLGACMSEAAWTQDRSVITERQTENKEYFARLGALFSYWSFRVIPSPGRVPSMFQVFSYDNQIILGATIPEVAGITTEPDGRAMIQEARKEDFKKNSIAGEGGKRMELTKPDTVESGRDYGHCAESWSFVVFCNLEKGKLDLCHGIAIKKPTANVQNYNRATERNGNRYAPMCVNCERLSKQIVRRGDATDKTVANFSVSNWVV